AGHGTKNILKLWDAATGEVIRTFEGHTDRIHCVAFSADGRMLASGSADKTTNLWDPTTGALIGKLEGPATVRRVAFSRDGQYLASTESAAGASSKVRVWNVDSRQEVFAFAGNLSALAFGPDSKSVATTVLDPTTVKGKGPGAILNRKDLVKVVDVESGR